MGAPATDEEWYTIKAPRFCDFASPAFRAEYLERGGTKYWEGDSKYGVLLYRVSSGSEFAQSRLAAARALQPQNGRLRLHSMRHGRERHLSDIQ
jgi:hypothetical protein